VVVVAAAVAWVVVLGRLLPAASLLPLGSQMLDEGARRKVQYNHYHLKPHPWYPSSSFSPA